MIGSEKESNIIEVLRFVFLCKYNIPWDVDSNNDNYGLSGLMFMPKLNRHD